MATRFYLRDAAPANDPGETERSTTLPVGDFQDYGISVRSLETTAGSAETNVSGSSLAHTDHDDEFFTSFSSPALARQPISAEVWDIGLMVAQGSGFANSGMAVALYIFREPSTVVGFISQVDGMGSEWAPNGAGRTSSFSGSGLGVNVLNDNDYLVLEVWRHTSAQAMSMSYTQELFYEGATDVVEDASPGDAASWIETPQDLVFMPHDRPPLRGMEQALPPMLHPRTAAPYSYWINNLLAVPEPPPPVAGLILPSPQLHPRRKPRAAPLGYWIDNLLAVPEPVIVRPMPQLRITPKQRKSPHSYWLDNLLAVAEAEALPEGQRVMVQLLPRRARRGSPASYMIDVMSAAQLQPVVGVVGGRGNNADIMVITLYI